MAERLTIQQAVDQIFHSEEASSDLEENASDIGGVEPKKTSLCWYKILKSSSEGNENIRHCSMCLE